MQILQILDIVIRITCMVFLFAFSGYMFYLTSKEKRKNLYLFFGLFFFFTGLNFLITEIDLYWLVQYGSSIFPPLIDNTIDLVIFSISVRTQDAFVVTIYLFSVIPLLYAIEKQILHKNRSIIPMIGLVGLFIILLVFIFPNPILIAFGFIFNAITFLIITIRLIWIYISLAVRGSSTVRAMAALMGAGFILMAIGILITSWVAFNGAELTGHSIALTGIILIFLYILRVRQVSDPSEWLSNVWIIEKESGICIFEQNFIDLKKDSSLISGFLIAMLQFGQELTSRDIKKITFEDLTIFYRHTSRCIITIAVNDKASEKNANYILETISSKFIREYGTFLDNWVGEFSVFENFGDFVERVVNKQSTGQELLISMLLKK